MPVEGFVAGKSGTTKPNTPLYYGHCTILQSSPRFFLIMGCGKEEVVSKNTDLSHIWGKTLAILPRQCLGNDLGTSCQLSPCLSKPKICQPDWRGNPPIVTIRMYQSYPALRRIKYSLKTCYNLFQKTPSLGFKLSFFPFRDLIFISLWIW